MRRSWSDRSCSAKSLKGAFSILFAVGVAAAPALGETETGPRQALAATRIAAGDSHTLAVAADGTVWAWGENFNGQLGINSGSDQSAPVQVRNLTGAVGVAGGQFHSLALKSDGTVWDWGSNQYGQLGDGTTTPRLVPVQVSGLTGVTAIAAGSHHNLALKSDGTVWAWGWNIYGQLGDASNTNRSAPVQVSGLSGIVAIAAGSMHGLALRNDGTVWAWGRNGSGQLGIGTAVDQNKPVQTIGLTGTTAIFGGAGNSMALKTDGTVWGWGDNMGGQLGSATGAASWRSPIQINGLTGVVAVDVNTCLAVRNDGRAWGWCAASLVVSGGAQNQVWPAPVSGLDGVVAVSGGSYHRLALKQDGSIWAWGDNHTGQLGTGTKTFRAAPAPVIGLAAIRILAAGGSHSLAMGTDGAVWGWGVESAAPYCIPAAGNGSTPVRVSGLPGVVALSSGDKHDLALNDSGSVFAWGDNYHGQLGDGTKNSNYTPALVGGLTGVLSVSTRYTHNLALKSDGTVSAWGGSLTNYGQLGDGTATNRSTPVAVTGLSGVVAVAAGGWFSLALRNDGTVWAWGRNDYGQLGDGTNIDRRTPVQVLGLNGVIAIAGGISHSLALRNDGTLWAWGNNVSGQLGDGTTTARTTPVQVKVLTGVVAVASGNHHSLALRNDGSLWAWGSNGSGQLGDRTTRIRNTPVQVPGVSGVTAMAGAAEHTLALTSDGSVLAWGQNNSGELGAASTGCQVAPVPAVPLGSADLTVTKAHTGDPAIGAQAVFTLTVRNIGRSSTSGPVTVTDTLPAGLANAFASGDNWSCSRNGQVLTCTSSEPLAVGASSTITVTADVSAPAHPGVTNIAAVSNLDDRTPYNDETGDPLYVTGAGCTYAVTPLSSAFPVTGGHLSFNVQADPACFWVVTGLPGWISVSGLASGAGPGTLTLAAAPNSGAARNSSVSIAGVPVVLTQAAGSCSYSLAASGQSLPASGGNGGVDLTAGAGCAWTASSPAAWLSLGLSSSGTGSRRVTYQAAANTTGAARAAVLTIAGLTFTVQQSGPLPANAVFAGSIPQVASGGGWKTSFTISNTSATAVTIRINFWANDGAELTLPMQFPQSKAAGSILGSTLDRSIEPGATLTIESEFAATEIVRVGWAEIFSTGSVAGLAVFRQRSSEGKEQEASVPLESRASAAYLLPFDNIAGYASGVALANHTAAQVSLTVVERDDTGKQIGSETIILAARGHDSFDLKTRWSALANKRGTIEVRGSSPGVLSVLGLRFHPQGPFTTLPVTTK